MADIDATRIVQISYRLGEEELIHTVLGLRLHPEPTTFAQGELVRFELDQAALVARVVDRQP
jgi:hypothetical protein